MHFQFIVAPPTPALTPPAPPASDNTHELLRQLLDVQREQLDLMQVAKAAETDGPQVRWQNFFDRWHEESPHLPRTIREVMPVVERAFLRLMDELTGHLKDEETGSLDNEFSLGEFLDRYAMRAGQLGTILNLLGQMADACPKEQQGG